VDVIDLYEAKIRELEPAIVAERAACLRAAPSDSFFVFFRCSSSWAGVIARYETLQGIKQRTAVSEVVRTILTMLTRVFNLHSSWLPQSLQPTAAM